MSEPTQDAAWPREGGCLCGAIRYTIHTAPAPAVAVVCHCTHCQRQSGSVLSFNLILAEPQFEQRGTTKVYTDSGDSGMPVYRHFCGDCGSPITSRPAAKPGMVIVKAGTLDDGSGLAPKIEVYCRHSAKWLPRMPDAARFDTAPAVRQAGSTE